MPIDLSSYTSVETGLFVRIQVDEYRTNSTDGYTSQVLKFSDYIRPITIDSESYTGLGRLVGISSTASDLTSTSQSITISLTGIPNSSLAEIIYSKIKGSPVEVWRVFFNATTGAQLSITGNPAGRFFGIVNNYSLDEEYDYDNKTSTNRITMTCTSELEILDNMFAGRRTNPIDQKYFYPTDISMDRVPNLKDSYYNFGGPV
jgi:hypothetical protein